MARVSRRSQGDRANVVPLRHPARRAAAPRKARLIDLAAAPPGTDAEAAGIPPAAEQTAAAAHAEMTRAALSGERRPVSTVVIAVAVTLIAVVTIAAILWTRA